MYLYPYINTVIFLVSHLSVIFTWEIEDSEQSKEAVLRNFWIVVIVQILSAYYTWMAFLHFSLESFFQLGSH